MRQESCQSAKDVSHNTVPGEKLEVFCGGWKPKLMELPDFSGSGAGASRERSFGNTGMPLGSKLSGLEDLGLATAPAADLGRSMALSLLQQ